MQDAQAGEYNDGEGGWPRVAVDDPRSPGDPVDVRQCFRRFSAHPLEPNSHPLETEPLFVRPPVDMRYVRRHLCRLEFARASGLHIPTGQHETAREGIFEAWFPRKRPVEP